MNSCNQICMNNVVSEEKLKKVQQETLNSLSDFLSKTYGPMGSYTGIISGTNKDTIQTIYSKDGLKVLKNILFDSPIELSIQAEVREVCSYVEKKVGDGTTSAVILSSLIYSGLLNIINEHKVAPRRIVKEFKNVVDLLQKKILENKKDITIEDVYDICMISTNGNEEVSTNIKNIYAEYGFNVNIETGISNDQDSKIKIYDGLTINAGYSDPAYINNIEKGTCTIDNAHIYAFQDPVDTPEMINFMEKIIMDNIIIPGKESRAMIPTVIIAPMISRDVSGILTNLISMLYEYNKENAANEKPPIMIITNLSGLDEAIALDITRLCNCKYIKKYINPDIQKEAQEKGDAPTEDTIHDFAGKCDQVISDYEKTKFINPDDIKNGGKNYAVLVEYLKSSIKNAKDVDEDVVTVGRLKKRLRCLESNMVEYLVGGISVSDRDSLRDLVEDAVKNCASAAEYGVGRAANFEALEASDHYNFPIESLQSSICWVIFSAYRTASTMLYNTITADTEIASQLVMQSIENKYPYNVVNLFDEYNGKIDKYSNSIGNNVKCSINTDIEILNAISKIITMMVTSNQCLLQGANINTY